MTLATSLITFGCITSWPMVLFMSSLLKESQILFPKGACSLFQPFPLHVSQAWDSWWLTMLANTEARKAFSVSASSMFCVTMASSLLSSGSIFSLIFCLLCTYRNPCCLWHSLWDSPPLGLWFPKYTSTYPLSLYSSQVTRHSFQLLYTSFLHFSFARSSLFIRTSLLEFLPDFLHFGMNHSWIWTGGGDPWIWNK